MTTVTTPVHFQYQSKGHRVMRTGHHPEKPDVGPGRVPRVARLMALAIKFEGLLESGAIADQVELAELGHVTRARVTQIMNLTLLAPDIQEDILHLPLVVDGRDPITERHLRPIAGEIRWDRQRVMWRDLATQAAPTFTQTSPDR